MAFYPQLSSGATAPFPFHKTLLFRTLVNETVAGVQVRFADLHARSIVWKLQYSGISDEERNTLEAFHVFVEGCLRPFTFFDPGGNLLQWSERLDKSVWRLAPTVNATGAKPDPFGGTSGIRLINTGQIEQSLAQAIPVPMQATYCSSFYAKSAGTIPVKFGVVPEGEHAGTTSMVGPEWRLLSNTTSKTEGDGAMSFALSLPAGAVVDVYGLQVQAQVSPSGYTKTESQAGIYTNTYFVHDVLEFTANGLNDHACMIELASRVVSE